MSRVYRGCSQSAHEYKKKKRTKTKKQSRKEGREREAVHPFPRDMTNPQQDCRHEDMMQSVIEAQDKQFNEDPCHRILQRDSVDSLLVR